MLTVIMMAEIIVFKVNGFELEGTKVTEVRRASE